MKLSNRFSQVVLGETTLRSYVTLGIPIRKILEPILSIDTFIAMFTLFVPHAKIYATDIEFQLCNFDRTFCGKSSDNTGKRGLL